MKRLLFSAFFISLLASCQKDPSICNCYKNDSTKKKSESLAGKCKTYQTDWEKSYNDADEGGKKKMDREFNEAIANCK